MSWMVLLPEMYLPPFSLGPSRPPSSHSSAVEYPRTVPSQHRTHTVHCHGLFLQATTFRWSACLLRPGTSEANKVVCPLTAHEAPSMHRSRVDACY